MIYGDSKKQDNQNVFGDHIGDDDSDTITNNIISMDIDLKSKIDPSNMNL
jgi:hypothetical protein